MASAGRLARAVEGSALFFDTASGATAACPFPHGLWIVPTGVGHALAGGQYTLTKVGAGGRETTVFIESTDEIVEAELHTDDQGSYWLVDRARQRVVGFFSASDGMHVGATLDPAPPLKLSADTGRVIERSAFFGVF